MSEELKQCSKCKELKLLSEFAYKNNRTAHRAECKNCYREIRGITKRIFSIIENGLKSCTCCGKFLPFQEFGYHNIAKGKMKAVCKNCFSTGKKKVNKRYNHGLKKGTPEHSRMNYVCTKLKISRKEYCENIEDIRFQPREKHFPDLKSNSHEYKKASRLKYSYGLTLEEYNLMLEKQNNKCAICEKSTEELGKCLFVDHDHKTDKIRALLCHSCNSGIGHLKESIEIIDKAKEYLIKHKTID